MHDAAGAHQLFHLGLAGRAIERQAGQAAEFAPRRNPVGHLVADFDDATVGGAVVIVGWHGRKELRQNRRSILTHQSLPGSAPHRQFALLAFRQVQPVVEAHHPARTVDDGHADDHAVDDRFAEAHQRQDRKIFGARMCGGECSAGCDQADAQQTRKVESQRRTEKRRDEKVDEVVVRQARVHLLVEPRREQRRHDGHAQQVGAIEVPVRDPHDREHHEHQRAGHDGELPAVHQRQRRHQQETHREPGRDACLHRPDDDQQRHRPEPDPLTFGVVEPGSPRRAVQRDCKCKAAEHRCSDADATLQHPGLQQHDYAGTRRIRLRWHRAGERLTEPWRHAADMDGLLRVRDLDAFSGQCFVHARRHLRANGYPVAEIVGPGPDAEVQRAGAKTLEDDRRQRYG